MALLSPTDYPSIRRVIDVTLDGRALPDAVIEDPMFLGLAEAEVLARDPFAASRIGDDGARVRAATIYLTAARIVPVLPRIVSEQFGQQHRYQRQFWDPAAFAASLRVLAEEQLGVIPGVDMTVSTAALLEGFWLASGRRGA